MKGDHCNLIVFAVHLKGMCVCVLGGGGAGKGGGRGSGFTREAILVVLERCPFENGVNKFHPRVLFLCDVSIYRYILVLTN